MIDSITFRVLVHTTENKSKVINSFDFILNNCKENNLINSLSETYIKGYYGNPMTIIEYKISKKIECLKFIEFCKNKMTKEDILTIISEINKRLDDNLNFYLRFDKQEAFMKRLKVTINEDSIFTKIKIKTYPKSFSKACLIMEELFV